MEDFRAAGGATSTPFFWPTFDAGLFEVAERGGMFIEP